MWLRFSFLYKLTLRWIIYCFKLFKPKFAIEIIRFCYCFSYEKKIIARVLLNQAVSCIIECWRYAMMQGSKFGQALVYHHAKCFSHCLQIACIIYMSVLIIFLIISCLVEYIWSYLQNLDINLLKHIFSCTGVGGYSYLYEPLWWTGMITSELFISVFPFYYKKVNRPGIFGIA